MKSTYLTSKIVQDEIEKHLTAHIRTSFWTAVKSPGHVSLKGTAQMYNQLISHMPDAVAMHTTSKIDSYEYC